jgi:hypothetical protein
MEKLSFSRIFPHKKVTIMTEQVENSSISGETKKRKTKVKSKNSATQAPISNAPSGKAKAAPSTRKKTAKSKTADTKKTDMKNKTTAKKSNTEKVTAASPTATSGGSVSNSAKSAAPESATPVKGARDPVGDGKTRISAAERIAMIEKEAYFIAEARGFIGGDPAQDWVEAEAKVDAILRQTSL